MITIVYYTSNRERETFELEIRRNLLNITNGLPIVSVSQKPIDFGQNICVGDIGTSDENILRQLLIGCENATTSFVATAEADCLYPPKGYFDFIPPTLDTIYRYTNLYISSGGWHHFRKKPYSLCAQIAGRDFLISCLQRRLKGSRRKTGELRKGDLANESEWQTFSGDIACINIKTKQGMRKGTGVIIGETVETLPYWGNAKEFEDRVMGWINKVSV